MQPATAETVLGDFGDATFTAFGVTSRFFRQDGDFYVETEGPDGELGEYRIEFTFGVHPLQQYLIAFPGGRYQVLGLGWDTRPRAEGGQRWLHLYEGQHIPPDDDLHWAGINQNWNYMCADCHSTNLRRAYDLKADAYHTTWSEIDVACEACHGPGSEHVAWARNGRSPAGASLPSKGLVVQFDVREDVEWALEGNAVTAARSEPPPAFRTEVETCGRCHARRAPLRDSVEHNKPLLDTYVPSLLTEALYHHDGQIKDEVYVYGSFLQSRMHGAGVTCSDCHDPHSLELRADGNAVCTQCHRADAFDAPAHHSHESGGAGSACVDCHAPETTYMVVDPRRDHSFRIPRPDLSVSLGVPNACTGCHADRDAAWAAAYVVEWYGPNRKHAPHFGETFAKARAGEAGATAAVVAVAGDPEQPAIVRATAIDLLAQQRPTRQSLTAIAAGLSAEDPLLRMAALRGLEPLDPNQRAQAALPLIEDPVRAVRLEAARLLSTMPLEMLPPEPRDALEALFAEHEAALTSIADRPENLTSLGNVYRARGKHSDAVATWRRVIARHPTYAPAYVNLADFYRAQRQEPLGEEVLRDGLARMPEQADLNHAYGLLLIRREDYTGASKRLQIAANAQPDNPRYTIVHALTLQRNGDPEGALAILRAFHERQPNDRSVLGSLASMSAQAGDRAAARVYAERLARLSPYDPRVRRLLKDLERPQ